MVTAPVLQATVLPAGTPVTAEFVRRGRQVELGSLPYDVRAVARHCVLDWIGVTVAGSAEPAAAIVRDLALTDGGAPQS
ncbi:MAG: MmgE/PrpD family, partial [Mycobacterium sp.]|nr:MmgE/PrpD family [Mycobacterium sp.]